MHKYRTTRISATQRAQQNPARRPARVQRPPDDEEESGCGSNQARAPPSSGILHDDRHVLQLGLPACGGGDRGRARAPARGARPDPQRGRARSCWLTSPDSAQDCAQGDDDNLVTDSSDGKRRYLDGAFLAQHRSDATSLDCCYLGWGDEEVTQLAKALSTPGVLPACEKLNLRSNNIGDAGATELAVAFSQGALPACERLELRSNRISNAGCEALTAALDAGALPKCKAQSEARTRAACAPLHAAAALTARVCWGVLQEIDLGEASQQGTDAVTAAAEKRAIIGITVRSGPVSYEYYQVLPGPGGTGAGQ